MERENGTKNIHKPGYIRPMDELKNKLNTDKPSESDDEQMDNQTESVSGIEKPNKKEKYAAKLISIPHSLNKALDLYVAELKADDMKLYDPVNEKERLVSSSSFIVHLIQEELKRNEKY